MCSNRISFLLVLLLDALILTGCRPVTGDDPDLPVNLCSWSFSGDYTEDISVASEAPWDVVKFGVSVGDNIDIVLQQLRENTKSIYLVLELSDSVSSSTSHYVPKCWKEVPAGQSLGDSIYSYTNRVLQQIARSHSIAFVQISRCVSNGLMWYNDADQLYPSQSMSMNEEGWRNQALYMNSAIRAVREICPTAKVVLQTNQFGRTLSLHKQFSNLIAYWKQLRVDYDVLSIYYDPLDRGTLSSMESALQSIDSVNLTDKDLHFETFYPRSKNFPEYGTVSESLSNTFSPYGQQMYLHDCLMLLQKYLPMGKNTGNRYFIYRYAASNDGLQLQDANVLLNI